VFLKYPNDIRRGPSFAVSLLFRGPHSVIILLHIALRSGLFIKWDVIREIRRATEDVSSFFTRYSWWFLR
jgi:hypothetical protein